MIRCCDGCFIQNVERSPEKMRGREGRCGIGLSVDLTLSFSCVWVISMYSYTLKSRDGIALIVGVRIHRHIAA